MFIFVGLWTALPFMMISEETDIKSLSMEQWTGESGELLVFTNPNCIDKSTNGSLIWPFFKKQNAFEEKLLICQSLKIQVLLVVTEHLFLYK